LLIKALNQKVETPNGPIAGKRLLAQMVAQALTTGQVKFPQDEKPSTISVKDWLEFVKWSYGYLEPPITKLEHTGDEGGPLRFEVEYVNTPYPTANVPPSASGNTPEPKEV
jgi:hypothetical protein